MKKNDLLIILKEAEDYVDLFLEDLDADEPTIDQPKDCLEHINYSLQEAIEYIKKLDV